MSSSSPDAAGSTTPPTITLNGNNPATITVGSSYEDLGAIVTDNQGHALGYKTFLNGTLVSNIVLDSSKVATDTVTVLVAKGRIYASSPFRAMATTAPASAPTSICAWYQASICAKRSGERPTLAGSVTGIASLSEGRCR